MVGGGKDILNARKLFLATHSSGFQEKQRLEISADPGDVVQNIRANLYGLAGDQRSV
jgi:hypothetical protein